MRFDPFRDMILPLFSIVHSFPNLTKSTFIVLMIIAVSALLTQW